MGEPGGALQGYNAALLEGLAELRARRDELSGRIREEEAERGRLQARLGALSQRLARTNESLAGHLAARSELDRSIAETETAYGKATTAISVESSYRLRPVPSGRPSWQQLFFR
ncbi:Sjoegren syndrome nuclear autoantigen 1-like isoform X3 [Oxyura jamaicensis]|uniref:Sjoegren syndrome nuclear autoantigen 1-like isoform X3 n=1 Tax=Oxyura jamaicensis TaxID=8884 RepID=UPI0015A62E89|nr:Sjoegren syndrome nuclear autoantigen 1-like isoform X3 [Oxyura jamaicensis]